MKFASGLFVIVWVLCGFAAVWMLDLSPIRSWKVVAMGPIALVDAMKEEPVNILPEQ